MNPVSIFEPSKYIEFLNAKISATPQYAAVCKDEKVLKLEVYEECNRDYTWLVFKDTNLRLIIPDAYGQFLATIQPSK
jgi:hypothetical protein